MDSTTYIYAIKSEQLQLVKIGVSVDPVSRLARLSEQCPVELQLIGVWTGDYRDEALIHRRLKAQRVRGEWFAMSQHQAVESISRILKRDMVRAEQRTEHANAVDRCVSVLAEKIDAGILVGTFKTRDILLRRWAGAGSGKDVRAALAVLEDMGVVEKAQEARLVMKRNASPCYKITFHKDKQ